MTDTAKATLGEHLRSLRGLTQQSLRAVADATGFSSAYLLKLERDEVRTPSPHLLRALARHFSVSYLSLMELAGYAVADDETKATSRPSPVAQALASEEFTDTEQRAIAAFISSLRQGRTE